MSSIFKKPKSQPSRGRNGFDMSFHRSFTAPCGMLLPVAKDFANPGDKYKLNSSLFIRTEALQSAAFQKFKVHVDWFFTPISQLYSLWPEFFYSQNDQNSSIFNLTGNPELPLFDVKNFLTNSNQFVSSKMYKTDEFGTPLAFNFRRLWDLLGYGSLNRWDGTTASTKFALLDFLTYHRIFYSHYALTDWTPQRNDLFNVDQFYKLATNDTATYNILSTVHYRPWRRDYFTNTMPQPLMSSAFANTLNDKIFSQNDVLSYIQKESISDTNGLPFGVNLTDSTSPTTSASSTLAVSNGTQAPNLLLSVNALRASYALDKLLRVSAFAGSHYDEQTLAHFGFEMPQGISKEVYFLGSQETDVTIGEVVSTSSTGATEDGKALAGSTIGDIAGKGFGSTANQSDISFTCPEHGYIMAILSIEPLQTYSSYGIHPFNRYRDSLDFYREEFDNLGMQPFFRASYDSNVFQGTQTQLNSVLGWQYRWSELKTNYDIVNESFWATDRSTWVATKQMQEITDENNEYRPQNYFYINPAYANPIFLVNFNSYSTQPAAGGSWTSQFFNPQQCYGRDPFLIDADFKMFKSSIMSTHSLPKF